MMPVLPLRTSRRAHASAEATLDSFLPPELSQRGDGDGRVPGELLTLPLRTIALDQLRAGDPGRGVPDGWRAVWLHDDGDVGALVDFRRTPGGRPRVVSYSVGRRAAELAARLGDAVTSVAGDAANYRLSLCRLPSIQMEGIWLQPTRRHVPARFFGLTDPLDDDAFLAEASRRAEAKASEPIYDPAARRDVPTA